MEIVLTIMAFCGLAAMLVSFGMPRPDAAVPSWSLRNWKPIWRARHQYSPWGWRFFVTGVLLLGTSLLLGVFIGLRG